MPYGETREDEWLYAATFRRSEFLEGEQPLLAIYDKEMAASVLLLGEYKLRNGQAKEDRLYECAFSRIGPSLSPLK
jgi:hypothetical protein